MTVLARAYPVTGKLFRSLGRQPALQDLVLSRETLCPADSSPMPPVTMLQDDWDTITAFQSETTAAAEQARVAGGLRTHRATERFEIADVLATPRGFYTLSRGFHQHGRPDMAALLRGPVLRRDRGFFALPVIGMKYFGHWLSDALPTALLCREDETLYLPDNPAWPHTRAYLDLLGLPAVPARHMFFRRMSFASDIGQNAHRQDRQRQLRKRLQAAVPDTGADQGVFIRRGHSGVARVLANEDALADRFAARGFAICASTDPLPVLLRALAGASVVISMEGSHLAHALFAARPGALLVTLNPADRFNTVYADYLAGLDLHMATLVVPRGPEGYVADADRLDRVISLAQNRVASG